MFLFFLFGNYGIHLFFKNRKQKLILSLKDSDYKIIYKVKTYVTGKSKISYSWRKMRSDLILMEKNLIIIPYNYNLRGLIKQYQPILQYSFDSNYKNYSGVSWLMLVDSVEKKDNKIILTYRVRDNFIKSITITELDFSEKDIDIDKLIEENKYFKN